MSERLRKLLLYQKYITFCIERELCLTRPEFARSAEKCELDGFRGLPHLADEIERLRAENNELRHELDLRKGRRMDCLRCGKPVPFRGAVFCSLVCSHDAYGQRQEGSKPPSGDARTAPRRTKSALQLEKSDSPALSK